MEIRIKGNAHELYAAIVSCGRSFNDEWYKKLKAIAGMTLVVETEYLFKDQFNTAPVEGVSEIGMRVHAESVDRVFNDEREWMLKCNYCGQMVEVNTTTSRRCPHCTEGDYLVPLSNLAKSSHELILRAAAERAAGGHCEVNELLPTIALTMSDGSEYFFQGEEAENMVKEYKSIDLCFSLEDWLLSIAQDW